MANNGELGAEETEKLLQFQDLTGIDDINRCRHLLESNNWDLEVAVQNTLSIQEGTPSVFNQVPEQAPQVDTHPPDQRVFTVSRSEFPPGLFGWTYMVYYFSLRIFRRIVNFIWSLIRSDVRYRPVDPVEDVTNFISHFEAKYGSIHPVFYQGTYTQVLNDAKKELKFLLVYLHSDEHQNTDEFCRCTLIHPEVVSYVNGNMLFWACSVSSSEGFRVSQALRENSYPFLGVVVLRDNRMTVVARLEGLLTPEQLIQRLRIALRDNEASIVAARAERHERSLNQSIRAQQDEAYLESLKADQEKERRKQDERRRKEELEREELEREMRDMQMRLEVQNRKHRMKEMIPEEPEVDDPNAIRMLIKLPNGTRLERRFHKELSLKYLYYFVFCHSESPDNFEIVTNFPKRSLPCEPREEDGGKAAEEPPSFLDAGLGRSEMVFVIDLDA